MRHPGLQLQEHDPYDGLEAPNNRLGPRIRDPLARAIWERHGPLPVALTSRDQARRNVYFHGHYTGREWSVDDE